MTRFWLPAPSGNISRRIFPVFLPFAGCPQRCIFCAQELQTGQNLQPLSQRLEAVQQALEERVLRGAEPIELAFYGGTFTALPWHDQLACLELAAYGRKQGAVHRVRCSTRPDAVDLDRLRTLHELGLDCIELGIQSFDARVLRASERGYETTTARRGCLLVREAGLELGIQLMPGLPCMTERTALEDVHTALALQPNFMRLYPCLVIAKTALAKRWQDGLYIPWDIKKTVDCLAPAVAEAWKQEIPIIRLSVAPEAEFDAQVLAGPRHAALGNMIQAKALFLRVRDIVHTQAQNRRLVGASFPRHCQGMFAGYKRNLLPLWETLGLYPQNVSWVDGNQACLYWDIMTPK